MHEPKPNLKLALLAVAAWCDGAADPMQPLQSLPDGEREIARAIARNQCELIRWYGDRVRRGAMLAEVPKSRRDLVARYVNTRPKI